MSAALEARIAALEAIVGRQAAALARLEGAPARPVADPLRGLSPVKRRLHERVLANVSAAFHVDPADIAGPSREGHLIQARFAAVWLFRRLSGLSLPRVAATFEYGDHTSVIHALHRAEGWREADADFALTTDRLAEQLQAEMAEWRP